MPDLRGMMLIAWCSLMVISPAGARDIVLRTNPFLQPVSPDTSEGANKQHGDTYTIELKLRATMVAGERSQANIGGIVIGLGEEVNGYQLIEVHPRHVVLDRDGTSKEIRIANSDQGNRD